MTYARFRGQLAGLQFNDAAKQHYGYPTPGRNQQSGQVVEPSWTPTMADPRGWTIQWANVEVIGEYAYVPTNPELEVLLAQIPNIPGGYVLIADDEMNALRPRTRPYSTMKITVPQP